MTGVRVDEVLEQATSRAAAHFADPADPRGSDTWVHELLADVESHQPEVHTIAERCDDSTPSFRPKSTVELTIVIPAYNEERRLVPGLERLQEATETGAFDADSTEIIVVNDGSTDRTEAVARDLLRSYPHHRVLTLAANSGKGGAVRAGIAAATGRTTAFMDSDMGTDPTGVPTLLEALLTADIAIGSRSVPGSVVDRKYYRRKLMGSAWSKLVNAMTDVSISDTQCGFKAFRTPVARLLFHYAATAGFAFDVEVLMIARHLGLEIAEVPVSWTSIDGSRVRTVMDPPLMVIDVIRSRRGLRRLPALDAILVSVTPGISDTEATGLVVEQAGPLLPVVRAQGDRHLVLLPLCGPAEIEDVKARLAAIPGSRVGHLAVPITTVSRHLSVSSDASDSRATIDLFA